MTKYVPYDGEVECYDDHCDEFTALTCPNRAANKTDQRRMSRWGGSNPIESELNRLWRLHGPPEERFCDVTSTTVEPWKSLAEAIYGIDTIPEVTLFLKAGIRAS